jgi:uncharacterized protein YlxP (DUF503 family)
MPIGLLTLRLKLPGCASLKEKRGRIKPVIARLRREFNLSVAETGKQDAWQEAEIACAMVSGDAVLLRRELSRAAAYMESHYPDEYVLEAKVEVI